ncbi:MAG: DNA mismatch repair endonuclease MutL [Negativicutes bacterium]|nr:DNA mismatch repair endonuclease MutL [Negativicutes bacterium]
MEQKVRILDQNTANQIAAGEVVEKPASVVKELVENSLDAGADIIEISITDGGIEYIRVVDNGSGMSEENLRLSVLRHATSKINTADDLLSLKTLGFRGEALPSIASVSKFRILTRLANDDLATSITIDGGENLDCVKTGGAVGTTVIVENLFFNVPARRKFLRTVTTEGRYINDIIGKIALSRPDVRFKLVNNDKVVVTTPGNGDTVDAVAALYGKNVAKELLPVFCEENRISIEGFVGKPTLLKGTRQWQTIFVNGRTVSNRMIAKAIDHAYQSQIPKAGFPFAVLNIVVDTASIDVNVHPQKSEIKFSDEGLVYRTVYHALVSALTKPLSASVSDTTTLQSTGDNQVLTNDDIDLQRSAYVQDNFWKEDSKSGLSANRNNIYFASQGVQSVFEQAAMPLHVMRERMAEQDVLMKNSVIDVHNADNGVDQIWPLGQIDRVFIVAQSENSLYLIDQHAAHERILYDKLVKCHEDIPSQQFLVPLYLDATPQEIAAIEENRGSFLKLGVDIEQAGEEMLRISSLPSDIKDSEAEDFIRDILKMISEMKNISNSDLRQNVLHYAACHGAIKAGEMLNMRQMRALILELCNTEHPFTCPHGRPCMIEISSGELYKMFKRT